MPPTTSSTRTVIRSLLPPISQHKSAVRIMKSLSPIVSNDRMPKTRMSCRFAARQPLPFIKSAGPALECCGKMKPIRPCGLCKIQKPFSDTLSLHARGNKQLLQLVLMKREKADNFRPRGRNMDDPALCQFLRPSFAQLAQRYRCGNTSRLPATEPNRRNRIEIRIRIGTHRDFHLGVSRFVSYISRSGAKMTKMTGVTEIETV